MIIDNHKCEPDTGSGRVHAGRHEPEYYEIVIKGFINKQRGIYFNQMQIQHLASGETRIAGFVKDQMELYGILTCIRDMGIPLLRVEQLPVVFAGNGHSVFSQVISEPVIPEPIIPE